MQEHYTKNEIDLMHEPMHDKLDLILAQTTKTNGRVDKLEQWKSYMTGGMGVIVIIVLPILVWSLSTIVDIKQTTSTVDIEETVARYVKENYSE